MDNLTEFNRKKYDDTFDLIYKTTMEQKENGSITIESLEALLRDQYIYSDLDWLGRGEIKDIVNKATIAALETILSKWKEELKNNS
ncbi:MAG: hypothetical protein R6U59_02510 [Eubacteriales bacterium]